MPYYRILYQRKDNRNYVAKEETPSTMVDIFLIEIIVQPREMRYDHHDHSDRCADSDYHQSFRHFFQLSFIKQEIHQVQVKDKHHG